jgi:DNA-binding MarR family transcriptional regulator
MPRAIALKGFGMDKEPDAFSRSICNNAAMRRATRRLGQLYDEALEPCGIKATQHVLLYQIRRLETPTVRMLADDLVMDISALGHTLKPLIRDGLIVLTPDATDGRARRVALTAAGEDTLNEANGLWAAVHERFENQLGAEKAKQLRETLDWIASPGFADDWVNRSA